MKGTVSAPLSLGTCAVAVACGRGEASATCGGYVPECRKSVPHIWPRGAWPGYLCYGSAVFFRWGHEISGAGGPTSGLPCRGACARRRGWRAPQARAHMRRFCARLRSGRARTGRDAYAQGHRRITQVENHFPVKRHGSAALSLGTCAVTAGRARSGAPLDGGCHASRPRRRARVNRGVAGSGARACWLTCFCRSKH